MENSRMIEITGNLRRDMKDLLGESAHIVTGFFKRGVCTVRAVADKWRTFTQDISAAVDELMKPPFLEGGPDAPLSTMEEGAEPIVTVTGIIDRNFPLESKCPCPWRMCMWRRWTPPTGRRNCPPSQSRCGSTISGMAGQTATASPSTSGRAAVCWNRWSGI